MKNVDIMALRVADLAKPMCNIHMWCASFSLHDAMELIDGWRRTDDPDKQVFFYKGIEVVWVKLCEGRARWKLWKLVKKLFEYGLVGFMEWIAAKNPGNYFANQCEFVLLATTKKGIQPNVKLHPQLLFHPKIKPHSRKPQQVWKRIERMYPNQDYAELFATETRPGWASLGLEIDDRLLEASIPWLLEQEQLPPYRRETMSAQFRRNWAEKLAAERDLPLIGEIK
jgi:N6-adenosine-specific RNA methylase IME4